MRIRTIFIACVSTMTLLAGGAAATFAVAQWHSYRSASEALNLSRAIASVLRMTEKLTLSRGPQNGPLLSEQPANEPARAAIAPARQAVADAIAAADGVFAATDYPERDAARAAIGKITTELARINAELDRAYAVPKAQRDPAIVQGFTPRMLALGDLVNDIANNLERSAASADATVGRLAGVARLSWDMRDAAGRRTNVLTSAVAAARPLSVADAQAASALTGEARHAWARLQATVTQIANAPGLVAAARETEAKYFGETDAFVAGLIAKGLAGGDYGGSFQEIWSRLIAAAQSALLVRDAALAGATARAEGVRADALLRLSVAIGALVVVVGAMIGMAFLFNRRIIDPLVAMTAAVIRLAGGDRETAVPASGRRDEIGEMAGAIETLRQNAIAAEKIAHEQEAQRETRSARAATIEALTRDFEAASASAMQALDAASDAVRSDARAGSDLATDSTARTTAVAAGAEQTSANVGTIATAAEAMSAAIAEIAQRVDACMAIARDAVHEVGGANQRIAGLGQTVERIGSISRLIQGIAAQTNLLALNATIEAARAGDAGRGFAVVAGEVKALATQTAKATDDITAQIAAIESETAATVQATKLVSETIGRVETVTAEIAAAMTQQRTTTIEIARNAQEAARGTRDVSANVGTVSTAMTEVEAGAHRMMAAADDLATQSRDLTDRIAAFLGGVRAA